MVRTLLKLCGTGMAASWDFSMGVLIGAVVGKLLQVEVSWWHLAVAGVLAFLPDFDLLPLLFTRSKSSEHHHQTLMHRPLLVLFVVTIIAWWFGGTYWSLTAFLCVFWHYVHDTKELGGGGLAWFWPFTRHYWSPFSGWETPEDSIASHSVPEYSDWIKRWLYPSSVSIRELSCGSLALALGVGITTSSFLVGLCVLLFLWTMIIGVWMLQSLAESS